MSENTKIEWADHSWSPWRGCTKVSPGCANCYAETLSKRFGESWGGWGRGAPRVLSKSWNDPIRWEAKAEMIGSRPRVFPSLCDWLDEEVPVVWLGRFLNLISMTPNVDWLLLTKRPELFTRRMADVADESMPWARLGRRWLAGNAPENVWFGVSVEDQQRAEERIPLLLEIPARIRWLSVEPLLGPVDISQWTSSYCCAGERPYFDGDGNELGMGPCGCQGKPIPSVDWVVVGGESGPQSRPCDLGWVREIVGQCKDAGVPVFVKQDAGRKPGQRGNLPDDLWNTREYPKWH